MRTVFLISSFLGLTGVYIFACGALNLSQSQGAAERFRLLDRWPFLDVTPLAASVTAAGIVFLAVSGMALAGSRAPDGRPIFVRSWARVLLAALGMDLILVAGVLACLLGGLSTVLSANTAGALYVLAVLLASAGAVLAATLLLLRRRRPVFLPALSVLFLFVTALSAMLWLGCGSPH